MFEFLEGGSKKTVPGCYDRKPAWISSNKLNLNTALLSRSFGLRGASLY